MDTVSPVRIKKDNIHIRTRDWDNSLVIRSNSDRIQKFIGLCDSDLYLGIFFPIVKFFFLEN